LKTATPLDDALKLWEPLQKLAGTRIETWISGFEVYIRKGELSQPDEGQKKLTSRNVPSRLEMFERIGRH
jgi:hypothetical protein